MWPAEKGLCRVSLIKSIQLNNETNCRNRQTLISNVMFHSGISVLKSADWCSRVSLRYKNMFYTKKKTLDHSLETFHAAVWFLFCHRCLIMCLKGEIRVSEYIWTHWWPVTSPAAGVSGFPVDLLGLQKLQRTETAEITNKYINNKINMKWINLPVLKWTIWIIWSIS